MLRQLLIALDIGVVVVSVVTVYLVIYHANIVL